jgi:hypothetical protein
MHSFHRSRGKIFFEVACAFGISASFVGAWMQTYAPAFLPAAAIAALYGLVHAFDMVQRRGAADPIVEPVETATDQGDLMVYLDADEPAPVIEAPEFAEPPAEAAAETGTKRKSKPPRQKGRRDRQALEVAAIVEDSEPEVAEAEPELEVVAIAEEAEQEVPDLKPAMRVVDTAPDEPEYVPATPLFEPEPFVRQHRAAFGRKAR